MKQAEFYRDRADLVPFERLLDRAFYPRIANGGQFVRVDGSKGSLWLQMNAHIDVIVAGRQTPSVTVEEKIVRLPGRTYTAITVETHSNLINRFWDSIGDGWIATCQADYLLYGFAQADKSLRVWMFDFPALREWFWLHHLRFPTADTQNVSRSGEKLNLTRCRVVPLEAIPPSSVLMRDREVRSAAVAA